MAETLSYQEPQNVTTLDNLTPEEQDSLKVGEEISQQEEKLYAGKYKDAQELEKAYVELQKKLGEGGEISINSCLSIHPWFLSIPTSQSRMGRWTSA